MKPTLVVLLSVGLLGSSGCADLGRSRDLGNPAVTARTLAAQVCSNCHGLNGQATSPNFPNLAGQQEAYLVAQLRAFRSHSRRDPAGFEYMWGLSRHLSDAQIQGLASTYASATPVMRAMDSPAPARIASGRAIFTEGLADRHVPACTTCHGDKGQGRGEIPRIAGQHADYLVKQLAAFQRADERPEGAVMTSVAHELSPQDIASVAAYAARGIR